MTGEQPDRGTVIHLTGDVDLDSHLDVEAAIVSAIEAGADPVVVDLSEVPFLDSSGVRALIHARNVALDRQARLTVRDPQPIVAQVLRLTQVAPLLGLPPA
ncbi:STAS domain-containing protein [Asanoa sp. WMMD1127]|uniref:STAS domain-containing protein n=1 Tax=Asanoa sp. WMMD1127 TaxID=3016107 RepID=UPI002417C1AE|nr:STAS domain-containing protein [Asanoa sp. WMMD1127]MDG4825797.1 STAS domain-containing protein [Asanoa sp. WMMD1127]